MSYEQDPSDQANISGADLAILVAERDSLAHQLNRQKQWKDAMRDKMQTLRYELDAVPAIKAERDALQAQLAAAQGQEPIGFVESAVRGAGGFHACFSSGVFVPAGTQLYTAPIPQQVAEPSVPEGWKLVPIEPTDAMMNCFSGTLWRQLSPSKMTSELKAYEDMLSAAPQPKEKQ